MNYAMILSGGIGNRLKGIDIPKQYYKVNGRSILSYSMETVARAERMDAYVIVAAEEWQNAILKEMEWISRQDAILKSKFLGFAKPGENRQLSILHGLWKLKGNAGEQDIILIQDAVRPLTSEELIHACIKAAKGADGAMPVLRMTDTVYYSEDGREIDSLLDRNKILAGQAPEAFVYGAYLQANEALARAELLGINGSSEPAVKAGMRIALVDGDQRNFKITTMEDLRHFERLMGAGKV